MRMRIVGAFLRAGRPRRPIVGAAVGLARAGERTAIAWATTDPAGGFLFRVNDAGPWKLMSRVAGVMLHVPIGYVDRDRNIDLVVTLGAMLAYEMGTSQRVRYA